MGKQTISALELCINLHIDKELADCARKELGELKAQVTVALNEKRLWLCKEFGIAPDHSWQNIIEYHDTMTHFVEGVKHAIASAEAKGRLEEANLWTNER